MSANLGRRFRLGLFVLGSGFLFVALLWFVLQSSAQGDRVTYSILFDENVKGMSIGSRVNFQGVPIGVVKDIRFENGKTRVEVLVDPTRASIQEVTRARMDRLLVTGQVTVELEGFEPSAKRLRPGSTLQQKENPLSSLTASLPDVVAQVGTLTHKLEGTLARVDTLLADENLQRFASLLVNLDTAAEMLRARIETTGERIDETLDGARAALAQVERASAHLADATADGEAKALLAEARAAVAGLRRVESELGAMAREATALVGSVRSPVQQALAAMRGALDDVRAFARQVRLAPDSLLFGVERPAGPGGGER